MILVDLKPHQSRMSSQSTGTPSDQTALSLIVYSTVSGSSEVFS
ncbi:hypothetical protein ACFQX6_58990 [Streptosporangium lutulentum]